MIESAELKTFVLYFAKRGENRLVQLLMSFRPEFEYCRASNLYRNPLPNVDSVIHELLAEETRLKTHFDKGSTSLPTSILDTPF